VSLIFALILSLQTPQRPTCGDVADCRAQAAAAARRGDFEAYHDLAWRAVQKGRRNDPELMYVLADAQALSGRYDDALVMLERLADMGVPLDAATNDDFVKVRMLPRWPQVAAKIAGHPLPPGSVAGPAATTLSANAAAPSGAADEAVTFETSSLAPSALAHDAVSKRFVVADRAVSRLVVIDEISRHVVNYASAASAGFLDEVTGFVLDARRGDLWVASAKGKGDSASSVLHKLQLVSGRKLQEMPLPEDAGAARLAGVTVTPDGTVYAIDGVGARVFRLRPGARRLEQVMRLEAGSPTVVAAADDRVLYVATAEGLMRVDVASRATARVKSVEDLTGFESLEWRGGSLFGVQRASGAYLVVRVALDAAGTRAQPRAILAAGTEPTVGALASDGFYYFAGSGTIKKL
jgi:hypothetical protein